jgi:hypothetical protein
MLDMVHSDLPVVWCQKTIAMLRRPLLVAIISKWQYLKRLLLED